MLLSLSFPVSEMRTVRLLRQEVRHPQGWQEEHLVKTQWAFWGPHLTVYTIRSLNIKKRAHMSTRRNHERIS